MDFQVLTFAFHGAYCNSYLLIEGEECLLIDPGYNQGHCLEEEVRKTGKKLIGVLISHGHYDHFAGLKNWPDIDQIPIFLSMEDQGNLLDPRKNVSSLFIGSPITVDLSPYLLEDEDEIRIGNFFFKVIATPFHTEGSVCFYFEEEGILFSGDTLFQGSIGRYDLPGSDPKKIVSSLKKLTALPGKTIVYPGHGGTTTIEEELGMMDL